MADTPNLPGPVVDAEWLQVNLGTVGIADVRWSLDDGARYDDFAAGHLPGAVFVDLDIELSAPAGAGGRHPLPPVGDFIATVAAKGLAGRPVICYDDVGGGVAARMWWMLDALGLPVAVLDGGLAAWPGPLERGASPTHPDIDNAAPAGNNLRWPDEMVATVDEVAAATRSGDMTIVDARSAARFNGEANAVDDPAGHMPGARSRPWQANLTDGNRFCAVSDLGSQLSDLGVESGQSWISTCGSGVTACHNLLAARLAGLDGGRLYVGSWSQWSLDPTRPIVTGPSEG